MSTAVLALSGLACLVVGWIMTFVLPGTRYVAWGILALGAGLLAAAFVIDFRRVRGALTSKRGRFGMGTTVSVALFVGIMLIVNALNVTYHHRLDFTGLAQFTLTSQTRQVLANLDEPVEVVTFFSPATPALISDYARNLLAEYANNTGELKVRHVDPDVQPDQARQYGLDRLGARYGAAVFRSSAGQKQIYGPQIAAEAEHAFTSAILEVTGAKQKKVYFLTGHGERRTDAEYRLAVDGLKDNLFYVGVLDLVGGASIPDDAAVLVIAGPQEPLLDAELEALSRYLQDDGRMLVLLDPGYPPRYNELISAWWVDVDEGVLIDPESYVAPNRNVPLVPRARNGFGLAETYFPGATAVIPRENVPDDVRMEALVWTSQEAWLDTDFQAGTESAFEEQTDREGPLAIGALIDGTAGAEGEIPRGTRLAVIGDSDFASDVNFRNGNNGDLFLTTVNWLAAGEEIISVDRKVLTTRRLLVSPEQARFLQVSSIGLLPFLLLAAAGVVWWKRR